MSLFSTSDINTPDQQLQATSGADAPNQEQVVTIQSTAPHASQPNGPGAAQPQSTASQTVSNPSATQPTGNATHPAIQHASLLHTIAETLAGGPRYKPVINDDGTRTLQRIPLDRKDIGMAIAMSAITGALSGLQAKGPNATAEAAGRGFATTSQMRQQADQEQEQRATQDFARRAGVFEANNRALLNAMQIGRLQKENHDTFVQASADRLSDLKENSPDAVKAEHLRESEASDVQKHSSVDLERVPDGTVPRLDVNGRPVFVNQFGQVVPEGTRGAYQAWDNTYALVDKNARTPLRDDNDEPVQWLKNSVDWGLLPAANLNGRGDLPSYVAGRLTHQISAANMLQSELKTFAGYLNEGKKPTDQGYIQPIDLKAKLKSGDVTWNDITNLQRAIAGYHGTGQINSPDTQLAAMRASADSKIRDSASAISALFGPTNLDNFSQKREFEQKQRDALAKETPSERAERQATAAQKRAETAKIVHDLSDSELQQPGILGDKTTLDRKTYNQTQRSFKKNADDLAKTEQSYDMFQAAARDARAALHGGKDITGAQSVVTLFNAIGLSATPLKGAGFRINGSTVEEHANARSLGESLYQKLLKLKAGDVITPQQILDYTSIAEQARRNQYRAVINEARGQELKPDFLLPRGNGRQLDPNTAMIFRDAANGDAGKAVDAAKSMGWILGK